MALPREDVELIEALILRLLFLDVRPNRGLVSPNGGHVVAAGPELLAREVLPSPQVRAGNVDRTLPFDEADHLAHGVLRGNRDQHVHVVKVEMALLHAGLALVREVSQGGPQVFPELPIEGLPPVLGNPHDMVLALPLGVG